MSERPKIKLKLTLTDKAIEAFGFIALVALWILTVSGYANLPETIPVHFNGAGAVDAYGNKKMILALPVVATVLFAGLTMLNKFPYLLNYTRQITIENAEKQYYAATLLMRILKTVIVVIFALIVYRTQQVVAGNAEGLGEWFLPLTLGLVFVPILFYIISSLRSEKEN